MTDRSLVRAVGVDAHCHIDLFPYPRELVEEAEQKRIHTIAVTNAPSVFFHTRDLCRGRKFVHAAIGLHPELVVSHGGEVERMWPHLAETDFVGEIGLDYVTGDPNLRARQRAVFSTIVSKCAEQGNKVISVHSRRAVGDVLSIIGSGYPGVAILHWFAGTTKELERAVELGCLFSINPAMLATKAWFKMAAGIPPERVLTETDGPFVEVNGSGARPSDVAVVVKGLAEVWNVSSAEAVETIVRNFRGVIEGKTG